MKIVEITQWRLKMFVLAFLFTITAVRVVLFLSPFLNLNVGFYNVHHLFIGAFLLVGAAIFFIAGFANTVLTNIAGVGSALVLDEIVYLIGTDGSDLAYLTPVSLIGAIGLTIFAFILVIIAYRLRIKKSYTP